MWPIRTILFFVLFGGGCLASLGNPIWGVMTYLLVYQMDPTETWWGIPIADLGIRFSLYAALCTLFGLLVARRSLPQIPRFSVWEVGAVLILVIAGLNTITGVGFGPTAQHEFQKLWKVLVFTLILGRVAAGRTNLKMVLWTLVAGCMYIGYDAYTAPVSAFVLGRLESIGGADFSTTSGAAAHLSAILPLVGVAFLISQTWRWRIVAALAGAFTVNAIVMCRTRSAFVGLLTGLFVAFLAAPRVRRYRIHALLLGGAFVSFALTDENFWSRMNTIADREVWQTDLATVSRKEIWLASLQILSDHPFGIGVGNFTQVIGEYDPRHHKRSTHNSLVVCFVELGIQGGLVFCFLVLGSFYLLYKAAALADHSDNPLETKFIAYGLLISLVTYLVTALGTQRFYCESFWWMLVFPLVLHRIVIHEAEREPLMETATDHDAEPRCEPQSVHYAT